MPHQLDMPTQPSRFDDRIVGPPFAPFAQNDTVQTGLDDGLRTTSRPAPKTNRTVLVIASRFPPVASVGAIRIGKFAQYLSGYGWQPVVLTGAIPDGDCESHDAARAIDLDGLRDLPADVQVYRLPRAADNRRERRQWPAALEWRLQKWRDRLSFPDRGIRRLLPAVRLAAKLHRRYGFDAIFSSGMPFSDHIIGLGVQSVLRRPWLADFRDPWVEYIHWPQWNSVWGRKLTEWSEAAVMRRASLVISVNDHMSRRFAMRYRRVHHRKFATISNGFDPADFPSRPNQTPRSEFRLLYAGSLYGARNPESVLEAFDAFLKDVPGSHRHATFEFAGRPGKHRELLTGRTHRGTVRYVGFLSHAAALRKMADADVNVVMLPNVPGGENDTTAKVYECLGSGRPILAAVPRSGAAAQALRGFDGVWLCDPDDRAGLTRAIGELYRRWLSGTQEVIRSASSLRPLTRRHQAQELARCLDSVVAAPKRVIRRRS
ncbi:MAG: glycosyltransferase [Planctomycetota bacterium]|nr:glycosyltransferase [Planctomycetota bacterium]